LSQAVKDVQPIGAETRRTQNVQNRPQTRWQPSLQEGLENGDNARRLVFLFLLNLLQLAWVSPCFLAVDTWAQEARYMRWLMADPRCPVVWFHQEWWDCSMVSSPSRTA